MGPYQPGDRVHFDGDRDGHPLPHDHEDYEPPAWGTVAALSEISPKREQYGPLGDRTPVRWDDPAGGMPISEALDVCLVPASEAPEPDPKES